MDTLIHIADVINDFSFRMFVLVLITWLVAGEIAHGASLALEDLAENEAAKGAKRASDTLLRLSDALVLLGEMIAANLCMAPKRKVGYLIIFIASIVAYRYAGFLGAVACITLFVVRIRHTYNKERVLRRFKVTAVG